MTTLAKLTLAVAVVVGFLIGMSIHTPAEDCALDPVCSQAP
jgi:hypothetical protein